LRVIDLLGACPSKVSLSTGDECEAKDPKKKLPMVRRNISKWFFNST
jgi:hypothetical protein